MNSINDWLSNPEGVAWSIKHFCPSSQSLFHYWFCSVMQATYAFWTPKFRIRIKTTRPTKQEFWGFCTQVHLIVSLAKGQINGDASRTQSFIECFKYQLDRNRVLSKLFRAYSCSQCGPEFLLLFLSVSLNSCVIECYAAPNFCLRLFNNRTSTIDVSIGEFQ